MFARTVMLQKPLTLEIYTISYNLYTMHDITMPHYQQKWQWTTLLKYDMSAGKPTAHTRVSRTCNHQAGLLSNTGETLCDLHL